MLYRGVSMAVRTEDVWSELHAELRSLFHTKLSDPYLADDLVQETFVRVHAGLGGLAEEARLVPWVRRVARNVLVDHWRGQRSAEVLEADSVPAGETTGSNLNLEVGAWLTSMIALLPEHYRQAVQLAEVEGRTQREVAAELSLSLSGAKSRVQRGRQKLRELLLDCCHVDFDRRGNVVGYERRRCDCRDC